jgi:enoyl-CoA hydratase/carnithine racemase
LIPTTTTRFETQAFDAIGHVTPTLKAKRRQFRCKGSSMTDCVNLSVVEGVADVRLRRPEKLNALNADMFKRLNEVILALAEARDVRVVVVSGEGRAFCAGLDLAAMASGGIGLDLKDRAFGIANAVQHVAWGWRTLPMPVIAAVHGVAFGAGIQIMAGADIRIGTADARLAIRETNWGLVPDMAGFALWRTLIRDDILRELTYSAREFSGTDAERFGFLTSLSDEPIRDAHALARNIADRSPDAISAAKRLLNLGADAGPAELLLRESEEQLALTDTENQREAVEAGMRKRRPSFHDRTSG